MILQDLTGKRFGKLVVQSMVRRDDRTDSQTIFWFCKCDCNGVGGSGEKTVRGMSLRNGDTKSCGCEQLSSVRRSRKDSIMGKVFTKLTVVGSEYRQVGKRLRIFYICACSCDSGKLTSADRTKLINGNVQSCGCLVADRLYLSIEEAAARHVTATYKRGAIDRCIEWGLSDAEVRSLIETPNCHYCGRLPEEKLLPRDRSVRPYRLHGIDRIDSSGAYTLSNCVPCCRKCNYGKGEGSKEDFFETCKLVTEKRAKDTAED